MSIGFEVLARDGRARRGRLATAHGAIDTPVFMPVGTAGTVKAMTPEGVAATGARLILDDTYHLMLRPGDERIAALGEGQATTFAVPGATVPALPEDRPLYLMGAGKPADLVRALSRSIDMFDCALPTRSERTGPECRSAEEESR